MPYYPAPSPKPASAAQWQKKSDSPVESRSKLAEILLELIKSSLESVDLF
jgi:hypothetical protein